MQQVTVETYKPYPKQAQFHADPHRCRLFGGARGPGKSRALLEEEAQASLMFNDDSTERKDGAGLMGLILRTSLSDLETSIISTFKQSQLYLKDVVKYNESKKLVTFPNGATLKFGYASNLADLQQYLGASYCFIGIDEVGLYKTYRVWIELLACLRNTDPNVVCRIAATANPGGPGHVWLKALFVDKVAAPGMESQQYNPDWYSYTPASYLDGPFAHDQHYLSNLRSQPLAIQKAWIEGSWDVIAGQYFNQLHPGWTAPVNTVPREIWLKRWISIDWGFKHYAAVAWHVITESGQVFTYRQKVVNGPRTSKDGQTDVGSKELAEMICEVSKGERFEAIYISPDAKQRRDSDAHPVIEQMGQVFIDAGLPFPTVATDDRVAGWSLMYQLLASGEWRISETCKEFIAAIPVLMHNTDKPEDILKTDTVADDCADCLRYGILSHLQGRVSEKPFAVHLDEVVRSKETFQQKYMAQLREEEHHDKVKKQLSSIGKFPSWRERMKRRR